FLLTLVELGYVRNDGRSFALRPRVLELGYAYLSGLSLTDVAQPHVEEFVSKVRESSSISVLDGNDVVYVVRVPTKRIMTIAISVGTRFPAYCTSMGRVLLAHQTPEEVDRYLADVDLERRTKQTVVSQDALRALLAEVRSQGYALVDQEMEDGLRSVGVPIRDASGTVVAAMNVSAHSHRVSIAEMTGEFLPLLRVAAKRIEDDLWAQGSRRDGSGAGG
ncbi:MAG TPA: IclR family transcriptional regulator C-terminal domain-containing protein, partial [Acidimicrobiales bacterium]|nr:IclR family transcriptional regulator C-terminal domain-containing protein [Acidimicrobiales bacterium]